MERSVAELVGETDVEALTAEQVVETVLEPSTRTSRSRARSRRRRASSSTCCSSASRTRGSSRSTPTSSSPRRTRVWRAVERRYGIAVEVFEGPSLGRQAAVHGDALWERNPDLCCSIRKIGPLGRGALRPGRAGSPASAATSRRRRAETPKLGWDERHELWKASPLADWTDDDVWAYVRERELPVNELHDRGYASIGCTHCTAPGHGREGRWAGVGKTECGLHA